MRHVCGSFVWQPVRCCRYFSISTRRHQNINEARRDTKDPRLGRLIKDDFAALRDSYDPPKHPVVLAHGLLGFDELRLLGNYLPGVHYWRGIREALTTKGVKVITATVAPAASIEERAEDLMETIRAKASGERVNIIAGLDSRHLVSRIRPTAFEIASLTTISSPHRGSSFADYIFKEIGPERITRLYGLANRLSFETGAFRQLTQDYLQNEFNPKTPDVEDVRYFSYGAQFDPSILSVFRFSHSLIASHEGPNDGLVSVESSKWGQYNGTLVGVSHLDLINWTNRLKWFVSELAGQKRNFNAVAFYLGISGWSPCLVGFCKADVIDMLSREGL